MNKIELLILDLQKKKTVVIRAKFSGDRQKEEKYALRSI